MGFSGPRICVLDLKGCRGAYVSSPDQSLIRTLIVSLLFLQSWTLQLITGGANSTHFWGAVGLCHAKVLFLLELKGIQEKGLKAIICLCSFSQCTGTMKAVMKAVSILL